MVASAVPGVMEMVLIVFQSLAGISGGQMPIGIPPKAEMPVMSQVAPDECLFYMSFAGMETPAADATNQTERLMAEPQVQALVKSVDAAIQEAIVKERNSEVPDAGYALVKQFLTCPWCVFVSDLKLEGGDFPDIHAGAMVYLGDQQAAFEKSLQTILKEADLPDELPTVTIVGKKFYRVPLSPKVTITWGIHAKTLIVGIGEGTIEAMSQRTKTPAPAWLTDLKKQLPIERRATTTYLNLEKVKKIAAQQLSAGSGMDIDAIFTALGFANLKTFKASTGLDEQGMVELMQVESDGPLRGLVASVVGSALTAEDLAAVPADANLLTAIKVDPVKLYGSIGEVADSFQPGMSQMIEMQGRQMAAATGFSSLKDLLGTVGETWVLYNSPSEGGPLLTGLTLSVEVNDSFVQTRAALEMILSILNEQDDEAPTLARTKYKGTEIVYLKFQDGPVPLSPAWCVKDGRLFISLVPQNIRTMLNRDASSFKSIVDAPEVAEALAKSPASTALFYSDPKSIIQITYPLLPYAAQALSSTMRDEAQVDFDAINVPDLQTILPYAKPMIRTLRNTGSGLEVESHSTLPGITTSTGSLPAMFGFMMPATHYSPRVSARRAQSMNNLKQIALAMHNYADARKSFPPAYSVDKKDKPLLSWRIQILPFIEEYDLYKQFHLDEPWDSPHNKKLIPHMPKVFKSPMSKAGPGKTTYLTVRTKDSVFSGKEKVGFRNIKDGTSNTIMTVEVTDVMAVTWTKPDDFVPDEKDPIKGLKGVYSGKILVGFCDGSVRAFPDSIDKEDLRKFFSKDGGEIIEFNNF